MKKVSEKQRNWDRNIAFLHRSSRKSAQNKGIRSLLVDNEVGTYNWIGKHVATGKLITSVRKKRLITIYLPEVMNFSSHYDTTVLNILAIRRLSETRSHRGYRLVTVNFDRLRDISTSAALVLTAELSKWDDSIRQALRPMVDNWDEAILRQFTDLGFFALFKNSKNEGAPNNSSKKSNIHLVRYIKGRCGDSEKTRALKNALVSLVGEQISKWTFLHGGLTEAITNVSHHAYPEKEGFSQRDKTWYLTGSYNEKTKELKIVFYDQGIGIPRSLPASEIWERILSFLSGFPAVERKRDEILLRAAVELDRTSTGETDRGKGLQDLLEFIRQRKDGYLSILSRKGLFKYSMSSGKDSVKTEHFDHPILGTLIIWSAQLVN